MILYSCKVKETPYRKNKKTLKKVLTETKAHGIIIIERKTKTKKRN
ncbi:hypothetical protein SEP1_150 [Staphylococcus phage phiIBB-SEP1]|uniref:Uncharacterized protein n=1 Tax=Staphylococcus phage phiIBB-SEP1 TaxID=1340769 RepID=W5RA08_9CAUD|nr:hypothetical protein FDH45_gp149 [Staphylococcus phage phiIBB-SEP1]AGR48277.1 hypothetical protein SEP1_150 [Staphylococcus phage phiIBB-SEP1]